MDTHKSRKSNYTNCSADNRTSNAIFAN